MAPDYSLLLALVAVFVCLDILVAASVLVSKARARKAYRHRSAWMKRMNRLVQEGDARALAAEYRADPRSVIKHLRRLLESTRPLPGQVLAIQAFLSSVDLVSDIGPWLASRRLDRRIEAYLALGISGGAAAMDLLLSSLMTERQPLGRLVILRRIAIHDREADIGALISGLEAGGGRRLARELSALMPLAPALRAWFDAHEVPESVAGRRLFLLAARAHPVEADWDRLKALATEGSDGEAVEATAVLADRFPSRRFLEAFGEREEPRFRIPTARLLGLSLLPADLPRLDPWFVDPALREAGMAAASEILRHHPGSEDAFLRFIEAGPEARSACLGLAIEHRLPALLYHSEGGLEAGLKALVRGLLDASRLGIILETIQQPPPPAVRAPYMAFLREELASRPAACAFLGRHLETRTAAELALPPPEAEEDRLKIPVRARDKAFLALLVTLGVLLFPAIFVAYRGPSLAWLSAPEVLYLFVFDFQFMFAYYTLAINGIYLLLLLLSSAKLRAQARLWECDLGHIVSSPGILPTVSIIAPAYNEEATIAESIHSLLSLAYPSYEIVVVNDGSKDATLERLIRAFDLEPSSGGAAGSLASMPVRTVYRSASLPNLTVVDKANGGKADALNAGLNRATGDYICTIDADSVLDPQALLRAMFQVVASEDEIFAIGGNVFPVNGCVVEHGHLQDISLSEVPLARFQTVEYLRSFVTARLGWTVLDSLLIISGAFGLFKRENVMELGGYLTGKGIHRQETVGEDMEIVVRMTRRDHEAKRGGKVAYAYNANCWTEVPETWPVLRRQRDRWHRGLMEVLCFHRGMALRPRYGATGFVALPYFFLFELIGPWLEFLGYAVLVLALALNLIDPAVPLIVFSVAVFFGILISIASILLAERQILYFRTKEFIRLLGIAVIENFGFRQLSSMLRVLANLQFFFVSKGWQKGTRRGFGRQPAQGVGP